MTFEERMEEFARWHDRLKERHDALSQSVEIINYRTLEHTKQLEIDAENIRQISRHTVATREMIERLANSAEALLRIAESHERRLTDLDGGA